MPKKSFSSLTIVLLIISTIVFAFKIQPARASGTIYIRADGSIDPPTAPINRDGDVYTLTGNASSDYHGIVVERDDIILDGDEYTVQGTRSYLDNYCGISLSDRRNVTVRNIEISSFTSGIVLLNCSNNTVLGTILTNNVLVGIGLTSSSHNVIVENNASTNDRYGIALVESSNNNITGNIIADNGWSGFHLYYSSYNTISRNTFVDYGLVVLWSYGNVVEDNLVRGKPLVYLEGASDQTIGDAGQVILVHCNNILVENLNLFNATQGVQLWGTNNSIIANNSITANNWDAIWLDSSSNNSIVGNRIEDNPNGIRIESFSDGNNVSGNNLVNNEYGITIFYSSNNTLSGNDAMNGSIGFQLWGSTYNRMVRNNVANHGENFALFEQSAFNEIVGNNITSSFVGISLNHESNNNSIYHNNFINNTWPVRTELFSNNTWNDNYPSGGNFWSDYTGFDLCSGFYQNETGSDGLGDTPYSIDANNQDCYPLMRPWGSLIGDVNGDGYVGIDDIFSIASHFGREVGDPEYKRVYDINGDGYIGIDDLFTAASHFGEESP